MSYLTMLWIYTGAFAVHELEEWNIVQFEKSCFKNYPETASDKGAKAWIGLICLIGILWCSAATIPGKPVLAAYLFLPAVFFVMLNAFQHIYWTFLFKKYAPGVVTSAAILIPGGIFLAIKALRSGYIPFWYLAVLTVLLIPGIINTVSSGKETPYPVRAIHKIGHSLIHRFYRKNDT